MSERKETFTPEQVTALVKVAEGDWRGLILTAFYCGARLGDCANLRWKNIDLISSFPTIRYRPRKGGKNGEVVTAIHPALADYLLTLPAAATDEAFLFPSLADRPIGPLSKHFRQLMGASTDCPACDSRASNHGPWPERQRPKFPLSPRLFFVASGERWRARGAANGTDRPHHPRRASGIRSPADGQWFGRDRA